MQRSQVLIRSTTLFRRPGEPDHDSGRHRSTDRDRPISACTPGRMLLGLPIDDEVVEEPPPEAQLVRGKRESTEGGED
ncbi:MAG: hypothetical protein ACE5MM_03550 [Nitrospiraceae bacterium]